VFRERLAHLITRYGALEVCGEADNIQSAMQIIRLRKPDIVIVDVTLRGSSGLELIKDLKAQELHVPVLVLSMHAEALYAERALRAGAKGYIAKHEATSTLRRAIQRVLAGEIYLSEEMTAGMLSKLSNPDSGEKMGGMELLTDRELEVFQMIGKGHNTQEIAHHINLGETTVDTYRARIRTKMRLRSAAEVFRRAAQWVTAQGV